jgi:hypothetical protein
MSEREALNIQVGDVATIVTAHVVGEHGTSGISLAPDASWVSASFDEGERAPVRYEATVFEITSVGDEVTEGTIIATTEPPTDRKKPGMPMTVSSGFNGYKGGKNNPTDQALKRAGVRVIVEPEGATGRDIQRVRVENPWETVGQYANTAIFLDVVRPPTQIQHRTRRTS